MNFYLQTLLKQSKLLLTLRKNNSFGGWVGLDYIRLESSIIKHE